MFTFSHGEIRDQTLAIRSAGITLYAEAPLGDEGVKLDVTISAEPVYIDRHEDPDAPTRVAPSFHTEWLTLPVGILRRRGLGLLDGYRLVFPDPAIDAGEYVESPGGIYQDHTSLFRRVALCLSHLGAGRYRVKAEGETEDGWTFLLDAAARIEQVVVKATHEAGDQAPSLAVEQAFHGLFDQAAFPPAWSRKGSSSYGWFVYEASPAPGLQQE